MAGQDPIFPGTFTLIFSGTTLIQSHYVQSMKTTFKRLTTVAQRQNLWAPNVILDGRYPAQVWEHNFLLYTEVVSNPIQFAHRFWDTELKIDGSAQLLVMQESLVDRVNFGSVYLDVSSLENPSDLLLYRAGFLRLRFVGTTLPTTV